MHLFVEIKRAIQTNMRGLTPLYQYRRCFHFLAHKHLSTRQFSMSMGAQSSNIFPIEPYSTGTPRSTPASYYRGGTSRAVIFARHDLPATESERRQLFLQAIGAPDRHGRQLNGFGAGISSLSKVCIVGRGNKDSSPAQNEGNDMVYDVTYEFVGIGIEGDEVDYAGNCGNMASAIGPWALEHGFVSPLSKKEEYMTVSFLNTNTNRVLEATFPLDTRSSPPRPLLSPVPVVPGVSGLGVPVLLSFFNPSGSKTSGLLPTGKARDVILGHEVTCVDSGNPCIFIRASDFPQIKSTILPTELLSTKHANVLEELEKIRRIAAVKMGVCKTEEETPRVVPKIALVAPPTQQTTLSKEVNEAKEADVVIRFISDGQPHRAIPLTGAVCTGSAAGIEGGVVDECLKLGGIHLKSSKEKRDYDVRIAQPSGVMSVKVVWNRGNIEKVGVVRNTRRIMEGEVFWVDEE